LVFRRSLTRLELSLAAAVFGIALVLFVDRMLDVMELAERTAMEVTLSNVTAALNTRFVFEKLKGDNPAWESRDPFELLSMRPPSDNWSYDAEQKELVYRPSLRRYLHTETPGNVLRFRLAPHRAGAGYQLVPAAGFQWLAVEVLPLVSAKGHCFS
jgi:hypothetical protein